MNKDLKHFGVVGMRWGVRRRQTKMANRTLQKDLKALSKSGKGDDMDAVMKATKKYDSAMSKRTALVGKKAIGKVEAKAFLERYKKDKVNRLADKADAKRKADKIALTMSGLYLTDLLTGGALSGLARYGVQKIAWETGKVIANSPLR